MLNNRSQIPLPRLAAPPAEIAKEADDFLNRIRERGGLFVQRTVRYASPQDEVAWKALELGKQSNIAVVRKAVEERLARRR